MKKKFALFVFAAGLSFGAFAIDPELQACFNSCQSEFNSCVAENGLTAYCGRLRSACRADCQMM